MPSNLLNYNTLQYATTIEGKLKWESDNNIFELMAIANCSLLNFCQSPAPQAAPSPGSTLPALVAVLVDRMAEGMDASNPPDPIDREMAAAYWRTMTAEFGREATEERTLAHA